MTGFCSLNQSFKWFGSFAMTHLLTVIYCHLLAIFISNLKYLLFFSYRTEPWILRTVTCLINICVYNPAVIGFKQKLLHRLPVSNLYHVTIFPAQQNCCCGWNHRGSEEKSQMTSLCVSKSCENSPSSIKCLQMFSVVFSNNIHIVFPADLH